jgi:hypothetical protein
LGVCLQRCGVCSEGEGSPGDTRGEEAGSMSEGVHNIEPPFQVRLCRDAMHTILDIIVINQVKL